jgi:hypothetical protein
LKGFYKTTECTNFEGASKLEASAEKWSKMKDKYEIKKKKIQVIGASPFD